MKWKKCDNSNGVLKIQTKNQETTDVRMVTY